MTAASAAKTRVRLASAITALNVLVASGFSIAGLFKPEYLLPAGSVQTDASFIFAMYAAARTLPLALMALVAIYQRSLSSLRILGLLAGIVQFSDGAVGLYQHDVGKIIGPLVLGALQMYAIWILRKDSRTAGLASSSPTAS
jgi:hypothetical protein